MRGSSARRTSSCACPRTVGGWLRYALPHVGASSLSDAPTPAPRRSTRAVRVGLVVAVVGGLVAAWRFGLLDAFAEPQRLRSWLLEMGGWGQLAFVLTYTLLQPFGVPGTVFLLVAPLIWSWPEAFALTMAGTMAASVVGFSFARFVARDWVTPRIPERFRAYDARLAERGFVTVVVLRFIFWMPPLLHAFFGVSRVPFWTHFWGSLVGYFLPLLGMAYFGEALFAWLEQVPVWGWVALGVGLGAIAILLVVRVRHRRRAQRVRQRVRPEPQSGEESLG